MFKEETFEGTIEISAHLKNQLTLRLTANTHQVIHHFLSSCFFYHSKPDKYGVASQKICELYQYITKSFEGVLMKLANPENGSEMVEQLAV